MSKVFVHLALGLALAGSAGAALAQAGEPITTKSGQIGAPPAGKGLIVFYRPGSIMGAALGCTVHEGDREVARLGSGKYFVINAEPGKHAFSTHGQAADTLNLEVEPDETYFVKCKIGSGIISGGAQLEPSDRQAFAKKAKGSSLWKPSADWQAKQTS